MYRILAPKLLPGSGELNSESTLALVRFLTLPDTKSRWLKKLYSSPMSSSRLRGIRRFAFTVNSKS